DLTPAPLAEWAITDAVTVGAVQSAAEESEPGPVDVVELNAAQVPLAPAATAASASIANASSANLRMRLLPRRARPDLAQLDEAEQEGRECHEADEPEAGVRVHERVAELPYPQLHAADAAVRGHGPAFHGVVGIALRDHTHRV